MVGRRSLRADGDVRVAAVGAAPHGLRRTYLASLAEPQELYVEQLVTAGRVSSPTQWTSEWSSLRSIDAEASGHTSSLI